MEWVFIVLAIAASLLVFWVWRGRYLLRKFSRDSLIVFGKKGHGKSLLFSQMALFARKTGYLSNTKFGHPGEVLIDPAEVSVSPNVWEDVLNGNVSKILPLDGEKKPVFLDDSGIYLPNFADSMLKKKYPSMPIAFAVWRHLYDAPIHINSQDVNRAWKMIREQADGFLKARGFFRFGPVGVIRCSYFSRALSAEQDLAPMKKGMFNKYNRAIYEQYQAQNGLIKDFSVVVWLPHHTYDSRYFRRVFFEDYEDRGSGSLCSSDEPNQDPASLEESPIEATCVDVSPSQVER